MLMNSFPGSRLPALALFAASLALTACGGGGSGDSSTGTGANPTTPPTGAPVTPPTTTVATTPGVWKGSIVSTTTGQASSVVALNGMDGQSVWMTTDGRVWGGQVVKMPRLVRLIFRELQHSDLILLADYRKTPLLSGCVARVAYVRACTRSVYRKTRAGIAALLGAVDRPSIAEDRV
jgi:hypothetical protein